MISNIKYIAASKRKFLSQLPKDYLLKENENSCWFWQGSIDGMGYGRFFWDCKLYQASRMSYHLFNGNIGKYRIVRHTCDNPKCVNPKHLILGTQRDNMIDAVKRNRRKQVTKLNEEAVKVIKWMLKYKNNYGLIIKLAKLHNVTPQTITDIKANKTWSWISL